jgi:hypothetical protein
MIDVSCWCFSAVTDKFIDFQKTVTIKRELRHAAPLMWRQLFYYTPDLFCLRRIFTLLTGSTALCFTANGTPLASRRIRICRWISTPDGRQRSQWREVITCEPLDDIVFLGEQCGSCVGVCFWFVSSRQQLPAPLAICSQLQLVNSVVRHGAVCFWATCISLWHLCETGICY